MNTTPFAIFSSFLISAAVLPASTNVTLVQWGEVAGATDIVTSTQSISTDTTFVSGDVDSPTVGSSYYPNASGRNPDFNVAGSDGTWTISVKQNASGDSINFSSYGGTVSESSIVIWEDFSPKPFFLDYTFSLNTSNSVDGRTPELVEYEFVMQDGAGDWYISATGTDSWGDTNVSNVNASSITWYEYTPYGNTPSAAGDDGIGDEPKSPTFGGAQAFGYRQEFPFGEFGDTGDRDVSYFQVMAVVPEPSSTALLGLGGLVMALRRKRG